MNKTLILTCLLCIFSIFLKAQIHQNLIEKLPPENLENIHVEKLAEDSLSSVFLIWVKNRVPLHKHLAHTESVYILEGEGEMQLGDSIFTVQGGSYIFIPKNTPHKVNVISENPMKAISIQAPLFDGTDRVMLEE